MSENPYIARLRSQFEALKTSAEAVQTRAASEDRDLTEDELRSVKEQVENAKNIAGQLEMLSDAEVRAAKVTAVTTKVAETETRAKFTAQDRDPGHYRSVVEGGQRSFFGDLFRAKAHGDAEAQRRLDEHSRAAVTQASGGTGLVPPKWLAQEYQTLARQARVVADRVRHLPLGNDPRPLILPKQTAGTADVPAQNAEGANNTTSPAWGSAQVTTDKDTLTPVAYAEYTDVSRQLLDSSDPAIDMIVMGDLSAAWDVKVEGLVCSAILSGGTAAGTTFATETLFKAPASAIAAVIDAQTAVAKDLRGPADLLVCNYSRFGAFRKLVDGNSRPLMPVSRYNPQNATGALGNVLVGDIEGLDAYASNGIPEGATEKFAVLRSQAVILAESPLLEFSFPEVVGPSAVRMGIWGYAGVLVRNPKSVAILTITNTAA